MTAASSTAARLLLLAIDGALELRLVHLRAPVDVELAGLVEQLVLRAPLRPLGARALPAPLAGRFVLHRRPRPLPGLAGTGALLIHDACGDLLGRALGHPLALDGLLDLLVLAGALRALLDSSRRHCRFPSAAGTAEAR